MINPIEEREEVVAALNDPSPVSWREIVKAGNVLLKYQGPFQTAYRSSFLQLLVDHLPNWPRELDRKCPATWPTDWRAVAEHRIKETDTYGLFMAGICGDKRLALHDGMQGIYLTRRIVGAARDFTGERMISVGQVGEADLQGGLTVEYVACRSPKTASCGDYEVHTAGGKFLFRLLIETAVEVKGPRGKSTDEQKLYAAAVRKRGGIAIVTQTVDDAVKQLVSERMRVWIELGCFEPDSLVKVPPETAV